MHTLIWNYDMYKNIKQKKSYKISLYNHFVKTPHECIEV